MGCDLAWDVQVLDDAGQWLLVRDFSRHRPPQCLQGRYKQVWADLFGRTEGWGIPTAPSLTVARSEPIDPRTLRPEKMDEGQFEIWPIAIVLADLAGAGWPQGSAILEICTWLASLGEPHRVRLLLAVEP
jgi:hypothetical protein